MARPTPHLYQLRREAKPHDSHGDPPLHAADECVFEEAGQPQSRLRSALRVLQFLPDTQELACDASDGSRHYRPRLKLAGAAFLIQQLWSIQLRHCGTRSHTLQSIGIASQPQFSGSLRSPLGEGQECRKLIAGFSFNVLHTCSELKRNYMQVIARPVDS